MPRPLPVFLFSLPSLSIPTLPFVLPSPLYPPVVCSFSSLFFQTHVDTSLAAFSSWPCAVFSWRPVHSVLVSKGEQGRETEWGGRLRQRARQRPTPTSSTIGVNALPHPSPRGDRNRAALRASLPPPPLSFHHSPFLPSCHPFPRWQAWPLWFSFLRPLSSMVVVLHCRFSLRRFWAPTVTSTPAANPRKIRVSSKPYMYIL